MPRFELRRAATLLPLLLLSCGTLIGLGDLDKATCAGDCKGGTPSVSTGGSSSGGGFAYMPPMSGSTSVSTGGSAAGGSAAGGSVASSGTTSMPVAGTAQTLGGTENGGAGGEPPSFDVCPGGPVPPAVWTEKWYEHNQTLKRVYYDDCIALYFDADVPLATQAWLVPFLDKAWVHSLSSYGKLGSERIYVVVHQGRYPGGHSSAYGDPAYDGHAVIDMGADAWADGDYDLPAHLLGFVVDMEGAHSKLGAPKSEHYGNQGFPLIYKYDLYEALGLTSTADAALGDFDALFNSEPYPDTYWFRDWFYPVWRDHGHAQVFANYMALLQKYYPVDANNWMPTMNYGQYFHFMSGAAGVDLVPLARQAFQWHPDFDDEITAAKQDFPDITY